MKIKFVFFLWFVIFLTDFLPKNNSQTFAYLFSYPLLDSTRSRDGTKTTKEKIPKRERDADNEHKEDISFSSCGFGLIGELVSTPTSKSKTRKDTIELAVVKKKKPKPIGLEGFYLGINIGIEGFTGGTIKDEYKKSIFNIAFSGDVSFNYFNFFINYEINSLTIEPSNNYLITNYFPNNNVEKILYIPENSSLRKSSLKLGVKYLLDISANNSSSRTAIFLGFAFNFNSFTESVEGKKEYSLNNQPTIIYFYNDEKKITTAKPSLLVGLAFTSADLENWLLDLTFNYDFSKSYPLMQKFLPTDWENINGILGINLGIRYCLF